MLVYFFLVALLPCVLGFGEKVPIGGLFDDDGALRTVFKLSVRMVNKQREENDELPIAALGIKAHIVSTDGFNVSQKACKLFETGVAGVFGPQGKSGADIVQSMCDVMEIPHISARWDPDQERMKAVNLYPYAHTLSEAFYDIIKEFEWKSFAVLYDTTNSLIRLHRVIKRWDPKGYPVMLHRLGDGPNYRAVLRKLKDSGQQNIILDCSLEILPEVLKQAQQVGIVSDKHRLIISSLDIQTLDLEPYQYAGMNLTGFRLFDPEDPILQQLIKNHGKDLEMTSGNEFSVEQALMFDAVQLFARAFKQLENAVIGDVKQLPCNGSQSWEHGISLANFMRSTEMVGLTGLVKFDTSGYRSDVQLDILDVDPQGINKVGTWNSSYGIEWFPKPFSDLANKDLSLRNTTFRVLIALTPPYSMLRETSKKMSGNEQYEGFAIDIIQEISAMLGFNYTFMVQEDADNGKSLPNGQWSGMMGKIINNEADLAITDLTITSERESAVDFTMPFLNLGISILFKKPGKAPPSLFSFMSPFSKEVWLYLVGSYTLMSLLFFTVGRICPAEWNNPYPCIEEPEELENQFSLQNSFWFTMGAIMQQGSEISPIGAATRLMAGLWWFFCLIMVSSYTANLAAFLTVETVVRPIKSVDDLVDQDVIKYGAKNGGATMSFFKGSNDSRYIKMHKWMLEHAKEVLTQTNEEGKQKVLNENYAFLMESASIEYLQERDCNVAQVGGRLDSKGYGIAMRKNATYRSELSSAVLRMQENGALTKMYNLWWKEKRGAGKCEETGGSGQPGELGMNNVGGVFLVFIVGICVSCVITVIEFLHEIVTWAYQNDVSFKEEFMEEMKFAMKCGEETKPVKNKKSESNGSGKDSRRSTPPYGFVPTVITTEVGDEK